MQNFVSRVEQRAACELYVMYVNSCLLNVNTYIRTHTQFERSDAQRVTRDLT